MLYAVIMRFDSLREITASLLAETRKLAHLGITFKIGRSIILPKNRTGQGCKNNLIKSKRPKLRGALL